MSLVPDPGRVFLQASHVLSLTLTRRDVHPRQPLALDVRLAADTLGVEALCALCACETEGWDWERVDEALLWLLGRADGRA